MLVGAGAKSLAASARDNVRSVELCRAEVVPANSTVIGFRDVITATGTTPRSEDGSYEDARPTCHDLGLEREIIELRRNVTANPPEKK